MNRSRTRRWRQSPPQLLNVPDEVMVLGAKRDAGRVLADRVIICDACVAADVWVVVKLSAAAPIKRNMRFVFIDN